MTTHPPDDTAAPAIPIWKRPKVILGTAVVLWLWAWLDWAAWNKLPDILLLLGFLPLVSLAILWLARAFDVPALKADLRAAPTKLKAYPATFRRHSLLDTIPLRGRACLVAIPVWQLLCFLPWMLGNYGLSKWISTYGTITLFAGGLAWLIWYVDRESRRLLKQRRANLRRDRALPLNAMNGDADSAVERIWDPTDLEACYYGKAQRRLKQTLATIALYCWVFLVFLTLLGNLNGCRETYEMPAGGGEVAQLQQIKVQKVLKKKFLINPLSSVLFNPPPIEEVKLELEEATKHAYTVGYGKGAGAGFSGGTNRGEVRFIRLEYNGGDWDQDFGIGADVNLLIEYGARTRHRTAKKTEARKIRQLANFPKGKSPPFVYMTGERNIHVSRAEIDILREYVTDKHGMIFADNGGSQHWHGQFFNLMNGVLPNVRPVKIPLDHAIHQQPYPIPFLPYVAPHGGKDAYGWVVNGRLAAYYHPGDIGDAWADGHAGVKQEIYELCYQLGINVIFYAHAEYNRWLDGLDGSDR